MAIEQPKTKSAWILAGLVGFLSMAYTARGAWAIFTSSYTGTAKYSGPYEFHGTAATLMGISNIFLAVILLSGLLNHLGASKRLFLGGIVSGFLGASVFFCRGTYEQVNP